MTDEFGRKIEYLRLSLTERCQQKCTYCSKSDGGECVKDNELRGDDFVFVAEVCAKLGFKKIRLTGGEPLLRRDLCEIISGISAIGAYEDIALTTNARLLSQQAESLRNAGLMRCNISLDSLNPEIYKKITGSSLEPVIEGISCAEKHSLTPIKLNTVIIKGINDGEIGSFIDIARNHSIDVRFIELMPMGDGGEGISNKEILENHPELVLCENQNKAEPAVYYAANGFKGRVGFISPMSDSFCAFCNRIRITSDGTLRPCLGANIEVPLREAIVERDSDKLKSLITDCIRRKPEKNSFGCGFCPSRKMNRIGG